MINPLKMFCKEEWRVVALCIGYALLNSLFWLLMALLSASFLAGCKASQPSYKELQQYATRDTATHEIPVKVVVPEDSAEMFIRPEFMKIDDPVYTRSKEGRVVIKATKRYDNSILIESTAKETTHQDTVLVKVPSLTLRECLVDNHVTMKRAEEMAQAKLDEYIQAKGIGTREIMRYGKSFLWLIIAILILLILYRYLPR